MAIDLVGLVREWVLDGLPYDRTDQTITTELVAMDARELLIVYHNWMSRHVIPAPRQVRRSGAYDANPVVQQRKADLDALIAKIERGDDVTPHLSTRTAIVWESSSKKIASRRHLDLMLIEWHVHHLHISQTMEPNGFVERDGPLLFVVFRQDVAFVLDLMTHSDFNRDHILKILADEWPGAGLVDEIKAGPGQKIVGLAHNYTEEERNKLRKVGVNTLVEIDGRVFKPAGGMTTAGTSIDASRAADAVLSRVKEWERAVNTDRAYFEKFAAEHGVAWPEKPEFEFGFVNGHTLGFAEVQTGLAVAVTGSDGG